MSISKSGQVVRAYEPFTVRWKENCCKNENKEIHERQIPHGKRKEFVPLSQTVFPKYGAPESTVTIVFYKNKTSDRLRHLILVEDIAHQNTACGIYYIGRSLSRKIMDCIYSRELVFEYEGQQCQISYYFVGESMGNRLDGRSRIHRMETDTDGLVDVQIYHGKGLCREHGDLTERITVNIRGVRSDIQHPIEVYYCPLCDEYYVNNDAYLRFCTNYGIPHFRLYSDSVSLRDYNTSFLEGLSERSPLNLYGYSVNKNADINVQQRRNLLEDLISTQIISKATIVSYLEFFIRISGKDYRKAQARAAWISDLAYIEQHQNDSQSAVQGQFVPGRGKRFSI